MPGSRRGESQRRAWARVFLPAGVIAHREFRRQAEIPEPAQDEDGRASAPGLGVELPGKGLP